VIDSRRMNNPSNLSKGGVENDVPSLGTKAQMLNGRVNHKGTFGPTLDPDPPSPTAPSGLDDPVKYISFEDLDPFETPNLDPLLKQAIAHLT
jgi:hypothetical protein